MTRRITTILRAIATTIAVVAVIGGTPLGLTRAVGWPLPTQLPTIDQILTIGRNGLTDGGVTKTLAVIIWIAWNQFTIAIAAETSALIRHRHVSRVPAAPAARQLAAKLIATIVLATSASTRGPPQPSSSPSPPGSNSPSPHSPSPHRRTSQPSPRLVLRCGCGRGRLCRCARSYVWWTDRRDT
jgi:RNA-binding protein YhbY